MHPRGSIDKLRGYASRFRQLFVIARNSSFAYKGRAVDVKQISRDLGVRYILEGSVRRAANRIRLFYKATELDPEFGSAHGMAAWCYIWRKLNGWVIDRARETSEGAR
jgi:hypothetical protein